MRTPLLLLSFLFSGALLAAEGELTVTSKITAAKVYLNGAQVTRTASRSLPVGSSTLVFAGLSQQVDAQSIQVNGKGGFAILGVTLRMNYLTESPKKKEIEELQAQVKKLEKEYAYEKAMQDVWVNEEQLLQKNSVIGGQQNGLTASQLTAVNDYVRERLRTTKANWLTQQEKLTAIGEEADKLRQQLAQLKAQAPRPTSEVVVEIDAPSAVSASFVLSYFVRQAGWTPAYDLRAKAVGQPIELLMKARIMNNTGEDWEKVEIALSSGNPTLGGVMPSMAPWSWTSRSTYSRSAWIRRAKACTMSDPQRHLQERKETCATWRTWRKWMPPPSSRTPWCTAPPAWSSRSTCRSAYRPMDSSTWSA